MATVADTSERTDDRRYMEEALALAARAAGRTSPNPMVGALVVAGGEVVGRGFHARAGEPHAEVLALREAGMRARGATVYVTLEPCAHQGRTGPCADALVAAGVRRVVVAMVDPDPQVRGRGLARLRAAGVEVDVGVLEDRAQRLNEAFIKHRVTGLPFVTLKWAMSLDGRIAGAGGRPVAVTGEAARRYAHELRNTHDVVLVGVGTVLADDPLLTCRLPGGRTPMRVVVDSHLRTPPTARVVATAGEAPTLVATTTAASPTRVEALRRAGVEVLVQEHAVPRVALRPLLEDLGRRGVLSVLVEGGATVHAAFLAAGLADKVIALVAPVLIGEPGAPAPVAALPSAGTGADAWAPRRLRDVRVLADLGGDVAIEGYLSEGHGAVQHGDAAAGRTGGAA
ncbi:MAG: bifunctional diaminohydroxyphosphoribosylaminopyrimidine deaminase/5-amino-6-(5-phosphoribosylamino)uracil reductase RibD [Armatimonadota bacterium]|nr:bifunctional diaminohydroxyphosphoribosylaminopyrimidine deaminase/5-amino-6-(5-phosphoribosylamino)uracil reductase RibD [Armatimonadota bacterium]